MTGFIVNVFPFRNRVSSPEAFEGLELGEGKPSRPVLRGPGGRKAAWLLGSNPQVLINAQTEQVKMIPITSPVRRLTKTYSTCDAALERSTQLEQSPEILLAASCPSALTSGSLVVFISDRPNHFPLPRAGEARRRRHGRRVPGGRYTPGTPSRVEAAGWGFVAVKPGGGTSAA